MTKVKVCGITRPDDARFCAEMGADFLGFIFVSSSPRFVAPERAAELRSAASGSGAPPKFVGVFRDAPIEIILRTAQLAGLDYIQLHGSETDDDVRAIGMPTIKAFCVEETLPDTTSSAEWLMFDSGGGTGRCFDWSLLARNPPAKPFFLAGGLNPGNVLEAVSLVRPDAIDLASGVESAPGVKDHTKVRELMERLR